MIGRQHEMQILEEIYNRSSFGFLTMDGRRRVGKTTILLEFAKKHKAVFYSAQEKNDALNLEDFSRTVQEFFDGTFIAAFSGWEAAISYISGKCGEEKTVVIIDEFPFIASANPSIKSILQHTIDHVWKEKNIMLILCGSSVSFMENEVMGYKSPLYGRITDKLEVEPFDYVDAAKFFPGYSAEEKLIAYGILGGIPRYLGAFDPELDLWTNLERQVLRREAFLNDEPQMLLRMELREPNIYNSILEAISNGHNRVAEIADHIHEDASKCSKYMVTLQNIRLIEKKIPCGENRESKRGIYQISDAFYTFWYRYVFSNRSFYELLGTKAAVSQIREDINDYMGPQFECLCKQYLIRQAKAGKLPFVPAVIDKWWGNNPVLKQQDDVDVLALSPKGDKAIFCECKFRNKPMPMEEYDDLVTASQIFSKVQEKYLYFISKGGYTQPVVERAKREGAVLLTLEDLLSDTGLLR